MARRGSAALFVIIAACGGHSSVPAPPPTATACIADRLGEVRVLDAPVDDECMGDGAACAARCDAGDGNACYNAGLLAQEQNGAATPLFERGCELGDSMACVNYGAALWVDPPDEAALRCAERVFQKTCDAGEHMGCGMRGRVMYDLAKDDADLERMRAYLDDACQGTGGFSCRVLAYHHERGDFGAPDAALIHALLVRACQTGDPDACGDPGTAEETFR